MDGWYHLPRPSPKRYAGYNNYIYPCTEKIFRSEKEAILWGICHVLINVSGKREPKTASNGCRLWQPIYCQPALWCNHAGHPYITNNTRPRFNRHRFIKGKRKKKKGRGETKNMDSRGIEPRTTPMLRGYYTTKPQAQSLKGSFALMLHDWLPRILHFPWPCSLISYEAASSASAWLPLLFSSSPRGSSNEIQLSYHVCLFSWKLIWAGRALLMNLKLIRRFNPRARFSFRLILKYGALFCASLFCGKLSLRPYLRYEKGLRY